MDNSANKEIALGLSRAIMTGQWDKVDALLADDFTYIGDGQPAINKQQYIYFMKEILSTGFTQMDMQFHRVIQEGDMVSVDYTNMMTIRAFISVFLPQANVSQAQVSSCVKSKMAKSQQNGKQLILMV
jgi:predicted SnoaL-like aldol condensation-catalyzing enzyme